MILCSCSVESISVMVSGMILYSRATRARGSVVAKNVFPIGHHKVRCLISACHEEGFFTAGRRQKGFFTIGRRKEGVAQLLTGSDFPGGGKGVSVSVQTARTNLCCENRCDYKVVINHLHAPTWEVFSSTNSFACF